MTYLYGLRSTVVTRRMSPYTFSFQQKSETPSSHRLRLKRSSWRLD